MNAICTKCTWKRQLLCCVSLKPPYESMLKFREFLHISQQLLSSFCINGSQTSFAEAKVADDSVTEPTLHMRCSFVAYRKISEWVIKFPRHAISVWTATTWMCFKASNRALTFLFLVHFFQGNLLLSNIKILHEVTTVLQQILYFLMLPCWCDLFSRVYFKV